MNDKPKFPREAALQVAATVTAALGVYADEIMIAGSLRRGKAQVGDVEILYIPRIEQVANLESLFGETLPVNVTDKAIGALEAVGILARRKNVNGAEMFGEKNKLMVHSASGIPVDLFAATAENWWNYLVCRTGGAETNVAICNAAIARGWKWNPYGPGFSRNEQVERMPSERAVFEFVGLPWLEPEERR